MIFHFLMILILSNLFDLDFKVTFMANVSSTSKLYYWLFSLHTFTVYNVFVLRFNFLRTMLDSIMLDMLSSENKDFIIIIIITTTTLITKDI